jgi:phosphate transport system permease protein
VILSLSVDHRFGEGGLVPPLSFRKTGLSVDAYVKNASLFCAVLIVGLVAAMLVVLAYAAAPTFQTFGFSFFTTNVWNPVTDHYGAVSAIYGTVVTSFLALLMALPVGFGIAFFLVELAPPSFVRPLRIAIELLAGIPSIVFGFWGLFVLAPLFQSSIQPFLIDHLGGMPLVGGLFAGPAFGVGLLTASCILAIMVLPFLAAFLTDVFNTVSPLLKESAYAIGATRWEVMRSIVVPSTGASVMGGIMLALGRALGETMAVTFVIGNAHRLSASLLAPGTTISASIANEFNEATNALHTSSLLALGLTLFAITFVILACGKGLVLMLERGKGA